MLFTASPKEKQPKYSAAEYSEHAFVFLRDIIFGNENLQIHAAT
jgi:hypothetical protein